jgi:hypothetical protein
MGLLGRRRSGSKGVVDIIRFKCFPSPVFYARATLRASNLSDAECGNAPDRRPRASDARHETETRSRGSLDRLLDNGLKHSEGRYLGGLIYPSGAQAVPLNQANSNIDASDVTLKVNN